MKNRGITRGRIFFGGVLLFAAVIAWFTGLWLSPVAPASTEGIEGIRESSVTVINKSAVGTLLLSALAAYLLFPSRRPRWPARDWAIGAVLAVLVLSSLYQLVWVQTAVLN